MSILSEKFHEQYNRIQEQFDEWTPLEQLYASIELTKKLQLSYRYFLSQLLFQATNQQENNDMFHHTIHQANTPGKIIKKKRFQIKFKKKYIYFFSYPGLSSIRSIR
jgi:hypothetical protein